MRDRASLRTFSGRDSYGRHFDDFEIGDQFIHWPGRTITESDDTLFALLTMNQHPLHIDAHYAASTRHGERLVVGTLVFSIVVGLTVKDISGKAIANLSYDEVRHLGPIFHGDTIYARSQVISKRHTSRPNQGIIEVETTAVNQRDEPILSFKRTVLLPERSGEP